MSDCEPYCTVGNLERIAERPAMEKATSNLTPGQEYMAWKQLDRMVPAASFVMRAASKIPDAVNLFLVERDYRCTKCGRVYTKTVRK